MLRSQAKQQRKVPKVFGARKEKKAIMGVSLEQHYQVGNGSRSVQRKRLNRHENANELLQSEDLEFEIFILGTAESLNRFKQCMTETNTEEYDASLEMATASGSVHHRVGAGPRGERRVMKKLQYNIYNSSLVIKKNRRRIQRSRTTNSNRKLTTTGSITWRTERTCHSVQQCPLFPTMKQFRCSPPKMSRRNTRENTILPSQTSVLRATSALLGA